MGIYKDESRGTWYVKTYYTDWTGQKKQKLKRGFKLQREAKEWERDFLLKQAAQPSMPFRALSELYLEDKKAHTKLITYETKKNRIDKWLLPFFSDKPVDTITAADIRKWQAELKASKNANNVPLSPGYMQNLVTELSSIFNFAVRIYGLTENPCRIAGNAVGKKQKSLTFWTKEEFNRFITTFDRTDPYYTSFLVLYYCGLRIGELEALTVGDINQEEGTLTVNKTYHLINGKGLTTPPKTEKANRTITLPPFLLKCIKRHISRLYAADSSTRLFMASHSTYARQMELHTKQAGVRRIRLHDLRHSHASLLIELGFSALLVSERLGHENVSTTLNIYSHLFPSKQSEVSERLEKLCEKDQY
ncbi:site-specific integrase [Ruminococcus sp. AF18-22]|nr:site-specific integrase [Ruminococcus sp. AF18-22]